MYFDFRANGSFQIPFFSFHEKILDELMGEPIPEANTQTLSHLTSTKCSWSWYTFYGKWFDVTFRLQQRSSVWYMCRLVCSRSRVLCNTFRDWNWKNEFMHHFLTEERCKINDSCHHVIPITTKIDFFLFLFWKDRRNIHRFYFAFIRIYRRINEIKFYIFRFFSSLFFS